MSDTSNSTFRKSSVAEFQKALKELPRRRTRYTTRQELRWISSVLWSQPDVQDRVHEGDAEG